MRVLTGCVAARALVISAISLRIVSGSPARPWKRACVKITFSATPQ